MAHHHGQIVEKIIRRDGHSISDISRLLNVNRRSLYNWFNQPELKPEIIYRIGRIINYDFSNELPEILGSEDFPFYVEQSLESNPVDIQPVKDSEYWKDKYYQLLKRYNLLRQEKMFVAI